MTRRVQGRPALAGKAALALYTEARERDAYRCRYPLCRRDVGVVVIEVDHVVPRSQGGPDTIENLVCLCERCHDLKERGVLIVIADGNGGFRFHDLRRVLTCESCTKQILRGERAFVPTPNGGGRWVVASA